MQLVLIGSNVKISILHLDFSCPDILGMSHDDKSLIVKTKLYPYAFLRLRTHGGCDQSAEDAYSSMAFDPTLTFVGGPCCPHSTLYILLGFLIMFSDCYLRHLILPTIPVPLNSFSVS